MIKITYITKKNLTNTLEGATKRQNLIQAQRNLDQ